MQTTLNNHCCEKLLLAVFALPVLVDVLQLICTGFGFESKPYLAILWRCSELALFILLARTGLKRKAVVGCSLVIIASIFSLSNISLQYLLSKELLNVLSSLLLGASWLFNFVGLILFAIALEVKKGFKAVFVFWLVLPLILAICQICIDEWIVNSGLPRESIPDVYTEYMAYYEIAGDVLDVAVLVAGVICSGIFSKKQVAEA
jgi:hypothetical protein